MAYFRMIVTAVWSEAEIRQQAIAKQAVPQWRR